MRSCGCKGLAHSSACTYRDTPMPGRADADLAPTQGERYFPIHKPLPDALEETPGLRPSTGGRIMPEEYVLAEVVVPPADRKDWTVEDFRREREKNDEVFREELEEQGFGDLLEAPPTLPTSAVARKMLPMATGLLDYFPAALVAVAGLSRVGNEQHNPGQPLHWARGKSGDEGDALVRHFIERGTIDTDGIRHSTKVAWRALALLQKELEDAGLAPLSRGSR